MKGTQHVEVSNRNAKFRFDLHRNITIVRGDSGTGKTTLYNMIADYTRLQAESGVNLSSTKPCVALMDMDWKNQLDGISNSITLLFESLPRMKLPVQFATLSAVASQVQEHKFRFIALVIAGYIVGDALLIKLMDVRIQHMDIQFSGKE